MKFKKIYLSFHPPSVHKNYFFKIIFCKLEERCITGKISWILRWLKIENCSSIFLMLKKVKKSSWLSGMPVRTYYKAWVSAIKWFSQWTIFKSKNLIQHKEGCKRLQNNPLHMLYHFGQWVEPNSNVNKYIIRFTYSNNITTENHVQNVPYIKFQLKSSFTFAQSGISVEKTAKDASLYL